MLMYLLIKQTRILIPIMMFKNRNYFHFSFLYLKKKLFQASTLKMKLIARVVIFQYKL